MPYLAVATSHFEGADKVQERERGACALWSSLPQSPDHGHPKTGPEKSYRNVAFCAPMEVDSHIPIIPFHRWDEKAGLQRDAIRSQCSTCSRHKEKETGYEKD